MKVLYVTPYVPSLIRVRPYNFVRSLARLGHDVSLLCATDGSTADEAAVEELRGAAVAVETFEVSRARSARNCLGAMATSEPLQAAYSYHPEMADRARELVRDGKPGGDGSGFDVVHVEHLRASRLLRAIDDERRGTGTALPLVFDSVDSISLLFEQAAKAGAQLRTRVITSVELPRTRRHEAELLTRCDAAVATSRLDKEALEALAGRYLGASASPAPVSVVTNGVDLDYFRPRGDEAPGGGTRDDETRWSEPRGSDLPLAGSHVADSPVADSHVAGSPVADSHLADSPVADSHVAGSHVADSPGASPPGSPPTVVLSGKMSYHANVAAALYFADEVLPLVWREEPSVRFQIVGKDPPEAVRRLATDERVDVTGEVHDLRPYVGGATAAVCPVRYAVGIQNKVLEAMAMGTPVVASSASLAGLEARAGEDLLAGDDAAELAAAVVRVCRDPELAARLGRAGRAYVERNHDWARQAEKLVDVYRSAGREIA